MATAEQPPETENEESSVALESGAYEIIRNRLQQHGKELRNRLGHLNDARKDVFGAIETRLLSTERVTTSNNCIPRDLVAIGNTFLFGYNVQFGLRTEMKPSDVFAAYELRDGMFHEKPLDLIRNDEFQRGFSEVYKYYKDAVFAKFFRRGPHLYMVFRVGKSVTDIKTFKWLIDGESLRYLDNRSDHEVQYPPQHDFEWIRTTRDQHVFGEHPHISIEDRVFVEAVGGDITIKVEDNTASGEGIYAEDVENHDQTLDDAEIYYAIVGDIYLFKIKPYLEDKFRYIVYNDKIKQARRLDAIEHACVLLPDDQGLIFSNGYYLQTGESKTFDDSLTGMVFETRIPAANGEDFLYVFYNRERGDHVLLEYNIIEQQVGTPLICHGAAFFPAGEMVCFKGTQDPAKHHALQIWQTPYVGEDFVPATQSDSFLYKVGNKDIVRGMAQCHEILGLIDREAVYESLYIDLMKLATDVLDAYFWLDHDETFHLNEPLREIRDAATAAVDEFEKVVRIRQNTEQQSRAVEEQVRKILLNVSHRRYETIEDYVHSLGELRGIRGDVISLKDLRYADLEYIDQTEEDIVKESDKLAGRCVQFLLREEALAPYEKQVADHNAAIPDLETVAQAEKRGEAVDKTAAELEMLIEIVSNLKIDDATVRTRIIDSISAIFSRLNTTRAQLKKQRKKLLTSEGAAEFGSQLKLLNQSVVNYLDVADTPQRCEEYLTKLMIQLEELEARFVEFDEFTLQLAEKREEVYNAFESRKLSLVEARNKRAASLASAAERIMRGVRTRVEGMESIPEIHGYFASDLMIEKVRDIVDQLDELGDSVKVDDIQSRLKTIREDAIRQLKDRQELFVEGDDVIKFGRHLFNVNTQSLELTTVLRDDQLCLHLTGTNFFEPITDEQIVAAQELWDQDLISESRQVYRAEFLAYQMLESLAEEDDPKLKETLRLDDADRLAYVQKFMGPRYTEGYVKGVHDNDASLILQALLNCEASAGLLRFPSKARAMAKLYWQHFGDESYNATLSARLHGLGAVTRIFPRASAHAEYVAEIGEQLAEFARETKLFDEGIIPDASRYLFEELTLDHQLIISRTAAGLFDEFHAHIKHSAHAKTFEESIEALRKAPRSLFQLLREWALAYIEDQHNDNGDDVTAYADELALLLMNGRCDGTAVVDGQISQQVAGLVGSHPRIDDGKYDFHLNEYLQRLGHYDNVLVPQYQGFVARKKEVVEETRYEMKLDEFQPRVLTSFVRNKLIDEVYLPLVGDNLAKQLGSAGENKRTDRMGLLLLISPPGYGKTTLMEYIANRLGLVFMKINGPAIGHRVTSLDPVEAPNAAAREELAKLNLALEMGDNVMLYVDDIQHCNPEFLQKFISLCDAQRKIEGVYKGRTRTYDLRGKKVAVVMAGNPYTESGEKFQIPDMLSNRADIYNLGEMIGDSAAAFEASYLENALTSNPTLAKLAARSSKDVHAVIRMAERDTTEGIDLEGSYSMEELNELVAVMKKLIRVRNVVLAVNRQYIASAAQSDEYRTEPAFKLQGSYRNMNRIAEKVSPIMNDRELETLILSNYENDAQTLTSDAEANLLKIKQILGVITEEEQQRWDDICRVFRQNQKLRGMKEGDEAAMVVASLNGLSDGLETIRRGMTEGIKEWAEMSSERAAKEAGSVADQIHSLRDAIAEAAASLAIPAEKEAPPPAPPPIDQKIVVQHRVPKPMIEIVQRQFEVMHAWLEPLSQISQGHSQEIEKLRNALEATLISYEALLTRMNAAVDKK